MGVGVRGGLVVQKCGSLVGFFLLVSDSGWVDWAVDL